MTDYVLDEITGNPGIVLNKEEAARLVERLESRPVSFCLSDLEFIKDAYKNALLIRKLNDFVDSTTTRDSSNETRIE